VSNIEADKWVGHSLFCKGPIGNAKRGDAAMLKNTKIGTRLIMLVGFMSLLLVGIGALGLKGISDTNASLANVYNQRVVPLRDLKVVSDMYAVNIVDTMHKTADGSISWDQSMRSVKEAQTLIRKHWTAYTAGSLRSEEKQMVDQVASMTGPLDAILNNTVIKLIEQQNREGIHQFRARDMYPMVDPLTAVISGVVDLQLAVAKEEYDKASAQYVQIRMIAIASIIVGLIIAGVFAAVLIQGIIQPLSQAVNAANQLARGEVNIHLETRATDETGQLLIAMQSMVRSNKDMIAAAGAVAEGDLGVSITPRSEQDALGKALSNMVDRLTHIISEVRQGASGLSSASQQISYASQSLSQGTSQQAASVEETSASLEQMSASITRTAENSREMEKMATKGARDAEETGRSMQETVSAMKMIAQKTSIVEEIAYQTNLLALNAAIEAARAGEHGRGFAVVASEVRQLAGRSQTAAKEISELAESSVRVAERSGQQLSELVPSIRKTAELVQEVAAASGEQSAGVNQVNKAMTLMDQVTQRNASASEELASTSEEMSAQAEALTQLISFFRTGIQDRLMQPSGTSPAKPAASGLPAGRRVAAARATSSHAGEGDSEFKPF